MRRYLLLIWALASAVLAWAQQPDTLLLSTGARLFVYTPARPLGVAIVMCPGGGYDHLAINHEGHDMALWMMHQGITYGVLEYRIPKGRHDVPLTDAELAMRTMRERGYETVGIMGGSAGGHLAATLATKHRTADGHPDFQILLYPVISLEKEITNRGTRTQLIGWDASASLTDDFTLYKQVTDQTPPAFIALSDDDTAVPPVNSLRYYEALHAHHIPVSLHIYPTGGHGWGYKETFEWKRQWTAELEAWLLQWTRK